MKFNILESEILIKKGDYILYKNTHKTKIFYTVNIVYPQNKVVFTNLKFSKAEEYLLNL